MDARLKDLVWKRARGQCEFCGIYQEHIPFTRLHIEHIVPRKHGGDSSEANLALACIRCNLHKGTNLTGLDPLDGSVTLLFHPRQHVWQEHFRMEGARIVGNTAIGRTTVLVLNMNAPDRIKLRRKLINDALR